MGLRIKVAAEEEGHAAGTVIMEQIRMTDMAGRPEHLVIQMD
jgi:hypothetical protein